MFKFNRTDTLPDWSITYLNGLVLFESKDLSVKSKVLVSDWERCLGELKIDINNPVSVYEGLNNICDYFKGK